MTPNNKKVVVGMSGGVDSSVALILLKKQGYEPIGVSLKYDIWKDPSNQLTENVCCSEESFEIAKHICEEMGCEHKIIDSTKEFQKEVVDYFKKELRESRTPNPCTICNRHLKFKALLDFADKHNIKYVSTGHFARNINNELHRAKDDKKDQTYSLAFLKKEWFPRLIFPLGDYTKSEIIEIAKEEGFGFYEKRAQSQDFCFISEKAMQTFLEKEIGTNPGNIIDTEGNVLGTHKGLHFYTIGQRKGLDFPNGPNFVAQTDPGKNTVTITNDKKSPSLYKSEITLSPYNLFIDPPSKPIKVQAKVRYQQDLAPATLYPEQKGKLSLTFDSPQRAVTPGQFAVFYKGSQCLGAGRII